MLWKPSEFMYTYRKQNQTNKQKTVYSQFTGKQNTLEECKSNVNGKKKCCLYFIYLLRLQNDTNTILCGETFSV